jgi:hypothetical protein
MKDRVRCGMERSLAPFIGTGGEVIGLEGINADDEVLHIDVGFGEENRGVGVIQ